MGRAIYEGVYDPNSPHADDEGFRQDVLDALRRMDMPLVRYPGGNFVSGYHWRDGVGPKSDRPSVRELAWNSIETNQFGTDEFMALSKKMNWAPMMAVNLGSGTPEEARDWVEYCNSPAGTKFADMRVANGHPEPYGIKLWCLGNEMDGPWQIGQVPAEHYAIRAKQAARMMKSVDPTIELVACGSCSVNMKTYMEWDREVLEFLGNTADYVSLHRYTGNRDDNTPAFLSISESVEQQIRDMDAVCRYVQAKRKSKKRAYLCMDEWNVWYKNKDMNGQGQIAPHLIEEIYNLEDALAVAGFLHAFVRNADVVKIANLAQIVNLIAPIITRDDDILIQSTFYPFEMFSKRREGIALRVSQQGPTYDAGNNGSVPVIDASAIQNEDKLHLFLTNRSMDEEIEVKVAIADRTVVEALDAEMLTGPNATAANSFEDLEVIKPTAMEDIRCDRGQATFVLPPLSFSALTLRLE